MKNGNDSHRDHCNPANAVTGVSESEIEIQVEPTPEIMSEEGLVPDLFSKMMETVAW